MRKLIFIVVFLALILITTDGLASQKAMASPGNSFPAIIPLPNGFRPEGVVTGHGPIIYAGSLADGAIYRANLRTGEGDIFITGPGRSAVGLGFDKRANHLFVSGGSSGTGTVYDAATGNELALYQLTPATSGPFINDVIVTREAAYFTNSLAPEIYRVPLGPSGRLPEASEVTTIPLSGEFDFVPGFNANGIEAAANGRYLIIVNSSAQTLYRVEPSTGQAIRIDLGGEALPNGDGLVLVGRTLYVVQNRLNQIAVIKLSHSYTSGTIVDTITNDAFRVPTTAALFGNTLYAVNARFGTPATPDTEYEIVQVRR